MTAVVHGVDRVRPGPSAVTIGVFDGVHRGHQHTIRRAAERARRGGYRTVAVTFDPHPAAVVGAGAPPALQTLDQRTDALGAAGADLVVVLGFTRALSQLSPSAFVERVLAGPLGTRAVVVGANFRFGHRAAGDVDGLRRLGEEHGFEVESVGLDEISVAGEEVSSSAIRAAVRGGDVAWARAALGRPFEVVGRVVRGDGRGRSIGVPTANLAVVDGLVEPGTGVYAGTARLVAADRGGGERLGAVVNVGTRPTFDGTTTTVEAHLLDVDLDLYDRDLAVALHERLRDERRFDGVDELVAQIRRDIDTARVALG